MKFHKCLSIKPPWQWPIFAINPKHAKRVENRTWGTNHRGLLFLHVSKGWDRDGEQFIAGRVPMFKNVAKKYLNDARGTIYGIVDVWDVKRMPNFRYTNDRWAFGPWIWIFRDPRRLLQPIPYKGQLGLFNISDDFLIFHEVLDEKHQIREEALWPRTETEKI